MGRHVVNRDASAGKASITQAELATEPNSQLVVLVSHAGRSPIIHPAKQAFTHTCQHGYRHETRIMH